MKKSEAQSIIDSAMAMIRDFVPKFKEPLDVDAVLDESLEAANKVREPGGNTQANHLAYLFSMAKVAALDNKDPKVKRLKKEWGKHLREQREARGLSLRAVSRKTYVHDMTIAAMERGEAHISKYPFVYLLFTAYVTELDAEAGKGKSSREISK